jgi:hypothetical protein
MEVLLDEAREISNFTLEFSEGLSELLSLLYLSEVS